MECARHPREVDRNPRAESAKLRYRSVMADGLVTLRSAFDPTETKARLLAILKEKGVTVFADIPHSKGAAKAGLVLGPSDLVIFGKPEVGTLLMQAAPTAGLDLPLKMLIWRDKAGVTWVSYDDPRWIAVRHGLEASMGDGLAAAIGSLAKHATGGE